MIPQIIYIVLTLISLGMNFAKHGEPKKENYNGWLSLTSFLLVYFLLYKGGFFNGFNS